MKTKIILIIFIVVFFASFISRSCQASDEEIAELNKKVEKLENRILELENQITQRNNLNNKSNRENSPFGKMDQLRREMESMFEDPFSRSDVSDIFGNSIGGNSDVFSASDFELEETDKEYVVKLNIKGMDKNTIDIETNKNSLSIKAETSSDTQQQGPAGYFKAKSFGHFYKTIPLPLDADTSKLVTTQIGDMLILKMPKKK